MPTPVDEAMGADRVEKRTIRDLWADLVVEIDGRFPGARPLYLTLSGAEGRDLELLAERGVFARTEVGGVAAEDLERLVAVESRPEAVIKLVRKFPGLRVRRQPIQDLVRSTSPTAWPEGEDVRFCRARIINIDLDAPLEAAEDGGQIVFPLVTCVTKFAQLHAVAPQFDWVLCLTLHGELRWDATACQAVEAFLAENCAEDPQYADGCRSLLGEDMYARIVGRSGMEIEGLSKEVQQKILMAFVPKRIARATVGQGWHVTTSRNLRYGGSTGTAPMVTWILEFRWDARASRTPSALYKESLRTVFERSGRVAEDGTISS